MDTYEMSLLYDFYGDLLTERQKLCFDLHYNQDLSLGEIASELGISRQSVYDNISRSEALLRNMEEKTGCVERLMKSRKVIGRIRELAAELSLSSDSAAVNIAAHLLDAVNALEE